MSELQFIFAILFLGIMAGAMWTSYKIGFREGTGSMIDFCKGKSKNGLVTMYFFGENIEFIDTLEYNSKVLDRIASKIEDNAKS
tara:strand:- start:253 stop:504 length:252 start_codon:yes stop_codon:yes gene_type:complete